MLINIAQMKPDLHGILGLRTNTCIIQVRAKTVDELPAGAESPTAAINPNILESCQAGARLFIPPKNSATALILHNASVYISLHF